MSWCEHCGEVAKSYPKDGTSWCQMCMEAEGWLIDETLAERRDMKICGDWLNEIVDITHNANLHWWKDPATGELEPIHGLMVPTKLMLIVSELAEAMEGHRKGLMDDKLPHRPMIEVELADALIRILDLVGAMGLDLGGAYVEKMEYNRTRKDHTREVRMAPNGKKY